MLGAKSGQQLKGKQGEEKEVETHRLRRHSTGRGFNLVSLHKMSSLCCSVSGFNVIYDR